MAVTRCGHTNMYYYHGLTPYVNDETVGLPDWRKHHNPIVVLRNPLDRVKSATYLAIGKFIYDTSKYLYETENDGEPKTFFHVQNLQRHCLKDALRSLCEHSLPYMNNFLVGVNFRIIDFNDLDQYIPRRNDRIQSYRTDTRVEDTVKAEDVYVENGEYSLKELQHEVKLYEKYMISQERVTPEEWKEMTKGRFNGMSLDPDYPLEKIENPTLSREKEISKRKNLRA